MILRLLRVDAGSITFDGVDISTLEGRKLKEYYAQVQGVFQDPFSSYNPIFKSDRVFTMLRHQYFPRLGDAEWRDKLDGALEAVSLTPADVLGKYPHQLSGGQLQRLLVARALLLEIKLLVADEIISMLDASTRIDVLNLLGDLKARGLGILFITHDLSLGNYISDRTMILGAAASSNSGRRRSSSATRATRTRRRSSLPYPSSTAGGAAARRTPNPRTASTARSSTSATDTSSRRSRERIPWEERPPGTDGVLWRSSRNPIVTREGVPRANSIFNSAVVPFRDGYAGVFRVDDTCRGR